MSFSLSPRNREWHHENSVGERGPGRTHPLPTARNGPRRAALRPATSKAVPARPGAAQRLGLGFSQKPVIPVSFPRTNTYTTYK